MSSISINFNLPFDEAIAQMASRGVVLPDHYYGKLQGLHRQLAFSIANIAKLDQLQAVLDSLTNHLKNGGTFAQWQKHVDVKALGLPKHRLDNIFRTNIQQAYNHGHWQHALANQSTHGYLLYDAINDSRTRPTHKANDGIIRKIDDPIWGRIWFSRSVYRCRCRLISLTEKQAIARSGDKQGLYKTATEDPLRDKAWDDVDVLNADVMGFGVDRAIVKRLADSQNPVLKQAFVKAVSVGEAQQLALNYGVKSVNYGGRLDIANETNIVLSEFKQRGLPIPEHVLVDGNRFERWAKKIDEKRESITAAFSLNEQGKPALFLNPNYAFWNDLKIDADKQYGAGGWATNDKHHVIYHEMGHFLHYAVDRQNFVLLRKSGFDEAKLAALVSSASRYNACEFVAEVFVGLLAGKHYSADIMELYRRLKGYVP